MKELLLGCGSLKNKRIWLAGEGETQEWEGELITLDHEISHNPDIIWDLNTRPLPFEDNSFDRIHAYEILEHLGRQGDWRGFFEEFSEYYRILKKDGLLLATVPCWNSMGAWGDPSHTRVLSPMTFTFLSQKIHERDVGRTVMSDFRSVWKGDFEVQWCVEEGTNMSFILKAIKT
jgi:predicted SAM-dependent methyltransferase